MLNAEHVSRGTILRVQSGTMVRWYFTTRNDTDIEFDISKPATGRIFRATRKKNDSRRGFHL